MKRQYLGDSKDSFKWDYHDFLVKALGYSQLQIAWMMTPDDGGTDGGTPPEYFPARPEIMSFCNSLRKTRCPTLLTGLPDTTAAPYTVNLYKPDDVFENNNRNSYFSAIESKSNQVLFLDPDNGFEPKRSFNAKHILYSDVESLLKRISPASVVTVFQHHRRKKFPDDFASIRQRLLSGTSAAIYWHSLMFVSISSSLEAIRHVCEINREYAKQRPVKTLT